MKLILTVAVIWCMAAAAAGAPPEEAAPASTITLRGPDPTPPMTVVSVDVGGVTVSIPDAGAKTGATERVLGWDRVASVEGAMAAQAAPFREVADKAWRARTRLERGDAVAAEPLFEDLFASYAGRHGPTAGAVAEGLLRCRLRRGVQTAAVGPWLAWLEATGGGKESAGVLDASPILAGQLFVDPDTGLVATLPPIWVSTSATQALARGDVLPRREEGGALPDAGSKAARLARLYQQAARFEAGLEVGPIEVGDADPGVLLVQQIVAARAGDDKTRAGARAALADRLKKRTPPWMETWCRVAIGRSLLKEPGAEDQLLGIAQLLHLPARMDRVNPYLTGVAMGEACVALVRVDDLDGAVRLRGELLDRFPNHPVMEWEPIRGWAAQPGEGKKAPEHEDPPAPGGNAPPAGEGKPGGST